MKRAVSFSLKVLVSGLLLAYLLRSDRVDGVAELLARVSAPWMLAAIAVYCASHVLNALRWDLYARGFGLITDTADSVRYYFAAAFLNLFAPGTVVGDLSRGIAMGRGQRAGVALASVFAHRLTGMVALTVVAGVAGLVQSRYPLGPLGSAACVLVPVVGVVGLLFLPAVARQAGALLGRPLGLPEGWRPATVVTLGLALVYHAMQVMAVVLVARAVGLRAPLGALALFVPLANLAGMVPVTVSGVGMREAVYVFLFGLIGISQSEALSVGLLGTLLVVVNGLVGLPAFMSLRLRRNPPAPG